jgi:thiol-disulfide isomerase/thioredoxin
MSETSEFKYRVVLFVQPGCPACEAMKPIWAKVAGEVEEEYPELRVGWGTMDVLDDDWQFLESLVPDESGQGTPEVAIFDEECNLLAYDGSGIMAASQLKDFVIKNTK